MRDIHIRLDDSQYQKFREDVKKMGYGTMSAYLREQIREIIRRAEEATE